MKKNLCIAAIFATLWDSPLCRAAGQSSTTALAAQDMANPMATLLITAKVVGAFILVAGLMALVFKIMQRAGVGTAAGRGSLISVLETRAIAPKKYISVVQIGDQQLAVGITENAVSLLCQLEKPVTVPPATGQNPAFATLLQKISRKKSEEAQ